MIRLVDWQQTETASFLAKSMGIRGMFEAAARNCSAGFLHDGSGRGLTGITNCLYNHHRFFLQCLCFGQTPTMLLGVLQNLYSEYPHPDSEQGLAGWLPFYFVLSSALTSPSLFCANIPIPFSSFFSSFFLSFILQFPSKTAPSSITTTGAVTFPTILPGW